MFGREPVPREVWGKDHWSTLAYLETRCVDGGGLQIVSDPRMRARRRHFRLLQEFRYSQQAMCMDTTNGTRCCNGVVLSDHDDWDCVTDFSAEGLLQQPVEELEFGDNVRLNRRGLLLAGQLRTHKAVGGRFSTFEPNWSACDQQLAALQRHNSGIAEPHYMANSPSEGRISGKG